MSQRPDPRFSTRRASKRCPSSPPPQQPTQRARAIAPQALSFDRLRVSTLTRVSPIYSRPQKYDIELLSLGIFLGIGKVSRNNETSVCRIVRKSNMKPYREFEKNIQRELMVNRCPGIPSVADMAFQTTCIFVVYSCDVSINLHTRINDSGPFEGRQALRVFRQIVTIVSHLHGIRVVHRDIKLTRFWIKKQADADADPEIVVLDLECCRRIDPATPYTEHHASPAYVAPEVLTASVESRNAAALDMWSLGVVFYALVVGNYPFQASR